MNLHSLTLEGLLEILQEFNVCMECRMIHSWKRTPCIDGEHICPWCKGDNIMSLVTVMGIEDTEGILGTSKGKVEK